MSPKKRQSWPVTDAAIRRAAEIENRKTAQARRIVSKGLTLQPNEPGDGPPTPPNVPPPPDDDDVPSRLFRGFRWVPEQAGFIPADELPTRFYIPDLSDPWYEWHGSWGGTQHERWLSLGQFAYTTFRYQTAPGEFPEDPPVPVHSISSQGSNPEAGIPDHSVFVAPYTGVWRISGGADLAYFHTYLGWLTVFAQVRGPNVEEPFSGLLMEQNYALGQTTGYSNTIDPGTYGGGAVGGFAAGDLFLNAQGMQDVYLEQGDKVRIGIKVSAQTDGADEAVYAVVLHTHGTFMAAQYLGLPYYDERGTPPGGEPPTDDGDPDTPDLSHTSAMIFVREAPGLLVEEGGDYYLDWSAEAGVGSTHDDAFVIAQVDAILNNSSSGLASLGITPRQKVDGSARVTIFCVSEAHCEGTRDVGCADTAGDPALVTIENDFIDNSNAVCHEVFHATFGAQHTDTATSVMYPSLRPEVQWPDAGDIADVYRWLYP